MLMDEGYHSLLLTFETCFNYLFQDSLGYCYDASIGRALLYSLPARQSPLSG